MGKMKELSTQLEKKTAERPFTLTFSFRLSLKRRLVSWVLFGLIAAKQVYSSVEISQSFLNMLIPLYTSL